jgi:membrane-associated phospholipid phosphatase
VWDFVTDFGDSAVTLPLAAWVLIFLMAAGRRRAALAWAAAVVATGATMTALKLVFGACGAAVAAAHILSPSGHTSMSTVVYGALAMLVAVPLGPRGRRITGAASAAVILGIAWSRVALHHHSRVEIVIGFFVGAAGLTIFRMMLRPDEIQAVRLKWLLLGAVVLVAGMHGTRWVVEPVVRRLALNFSFFC